MKSEKTMLLLLLLCGNALVGAELRGTTARMVDPELKNNNPIESHLGANAFSNTRTLQTTETGPFCKDYMACLFVHGGPNFVPPNATCCPRNDGSFATCCGDSDNKNDPPTDNSTIPPLPTMPPPTTPSPTTPIATAAPTPSSATTPFAWVAAHDQIRQKYHAMYNATYVPVQWDLNLEADAQEYANFLMSQYVATGLTDSATCTSTFHTYGCDEARYGGENMFASYGFSPTAEHVLQSWAGDTVAANAGTSFTQVIWRATKWIGCGMASSNNCYYYVCRYVAPGNCNVDATNVMALAMADTSPCEPLLPESP